MFRKLLGRDSDSYSSAEEAAVSRLAMAYRRLIVEGGRVNTKSEAGFNACVQFLEGLDASAQTLRLDPASRTYRVAFTINYRALFPDESRNYRVDVLEASVEQYAVIWVNGDKFEFSAEAMRRAEALQKSWSDLGVILERWHQSTDQPRLVSRPLRSDVRNLLVGLDVAWASFEHKYIAELIDIEEKARRLIVQAINQERSLQLMEAHYGPSEALQQVPEYKEKLSSLVACISHLNSVANFRRKGRDDLTAGIYIDAMATLARCDAAERNGDNAELLAAAHTLSTDIVDAFVEMREYLREVERCLERVDPHLCNNVGLVSKLVDWEESWEVGTRYVQHEKLMNAVCDVVAQIRLAQRIAPTLASMCDDCDVELFMVLPRILWLRALEKPAILMDLFKGLLPNRFGDSKKISSEDSWPCDPELEALRNKYRKAVAILMGQQKFSGVAYASEHDNFAWRLLIKRIVSGAGSSETEEAYSSLPPACRAFAEQAVEDFMHDLEARSIELQRHVPEDWNTCSAILVQCLTGSKQRSQTGPFRV
eukprot:TRINITY_DN3114_c0_g2_i1.p1 TRINITY_DN3114_c0_g2~~TRINITY_DN3114_c0_g2_i1.p1  ORF type:complete len:538 (+),score=105.93 TRINITY_DN3114_c0_g2_i1:60-1673(+)